MKKAILILTGLTFFVVGSMFCDTQYKREVVATEVTPNGTVFTDNLGYEWESLDLYEQGKSYTLIMDTMHTDDNISDDVIVKVK